MKRLLVLTLALAVMASIVSGVAFAAPGDPSPSPAFSDIAGHAAEGDLTALGSLRIFAGDYGLGGPVRPDDPITREQYCKIVMVGTGRSALAESLRNIKPDFADSGLIQKWAWGYIKAATAAGVITGYVENGVKTFRPADFVKYSEAVVMLIRSVNGHKERVDPTGWPHNVIYYGATNGFTGSVTPGDPNAPCTRGDMARMLLATMKVPPLNPDGSPDAAGAILTDLGAGARWFEGRVGSRDGSKLYLSTIMGYLELAGSVYLVGASTYSELTGVEVEVVCDTDRKVVFIRRLGGASNSGAFEKKDVDALGTYIQLESDQKFYYTAPLAVDLNKAAHAHNQNDLRPGDYVVVNAEAGRAMAVTATRYDLVKTRVFLGLPPAPVYLDAPEDILGSAQSASGVTPARITFAADSPFWYYDHVIDSYRHAHDGTLELAAACSVRINGVPATPNDLKAGDVLKAATKGADGYTDKTSILAVWATRTLVDGTVASNSSSTTSEGTVYSSTLNVGAVTRTVDIFRPSQGAYYLPSSLAVGQRYKLALNEKGQAFDAIDFVSTNAVVYVKRASTYSGTPPTYSITVDNAGQEQVITCTGDASPWVSKFGKLTIDGGTGKATAFLPHVPAAGFTVAAAVASGVTLQTTAPPGTYFCAAPAVYEKTGPDTFVYIGRTGLSVGWAVKAHLDPSNVPVLIIYEP